jgi:hypothetical protein
MTVGATRLVVSTAVALVALVAACSDSDRAGDTLVPLPVSGATTPPPTSAAVSTPSSTPSSSPTVSTEVPQLVGDWDGAEFDAGVIKNVGELGGYRTIDFDRYSYQDPQRGVTDATDFSEEPIEYAWKESPFVNIQEQLRTFVLADDVEVLVLGGEAADRPCESPGPRPSPTWVPVGVSYLDQAPASEDIATLTYSDTGQVTRIRFTHGCV